MAARLEVMVTLDDFLICMSKCLPAKKGEGLKNTKKKYFFILFNDDEEES